MKKNILIYGIISGLMVSTFMLISMNYLSHCEDNVDYNTSMMISYASMLVAFSLVFVGIRNYRDKFNQGFISFGKAFGIGLAIVLIASTMYVISWRIDYVYFMPDFMDKFSAKMLDDLKSSGASETEIAEKTAELAKSTEMYKKPLYFFMITYMEILPIGILVSLISSLILKRKQSQPA